MPVVTDHDAVPVTPVYTIVITENDEASVDGHPVDKLPGQDARAAALANTQERAARLDRPVRVTAKEPDGSSWPLIVDYDGSGSTDQTNGLHTQQLANAAKYVGWAPPYFPKGG